MNEVQGRLKIVLDDIHRQLVPLINDAGYGPALRDRHIDYLPEAECEQAAMKHRGRKNQNVLLLETAVNTPIYPLSPRISGDAISLRLIDAEDETICTGETVWIDRMSSIVDEASFVIQKQSFDQPLRIAERKLEILRAEKSSAPEL
jgi:hypothetical protein